VTDIWSQIGKTLSLLYFIFLPFIPLAVLISNAIYWFIDFFAYSADDDLAAWRPSMEKNFFASFFLSSSFIMEFGTPFTYYNMFSV